MNSKTMFYCIVSCHRRFNVAYSN